MYISVSVQRFNSQFANEYSRSTQISLFTEPITIINTVSNVNINTFCFNNKNKNGREKLLLHTYKATRLSQVALHIYRY